jgi:hypothetical protein
MAAKTNETDATRDACMAAKTPAEFARAIGKDGRSVRNTLRSRFGVYVSRGGTFDDTLKAALYAHLNGDGDALDAWRDAQA